MPWISAVAIVAVIAIAAAFYAGRFGSMPARKPDLPVLSLPDGDIDATCLRKVKFPVVIRGYAMSDVDALLERLADQLAKQSEAKAEPTVPKRALADSSAESEKSSSTQAEEA